MAATPQDIAALATQLCAAAQLPATSVTAEQVDASTIRLNIASSHPALLIGRNGEALFALQHLLRLIVKNAGGPDAPHVVVDVANYRREQEENIVLIAQDIASRVRQTGLAYEFPPMLSYKRRAIHTFFTNNDYADLAVFSVGEGANRRVRVEPKEARDIDDPALP